MRSCKSLPLHYKRTSSLGGASRAFPLKPVAPLLILALAAGPSSPSQWPPTLLHSARAAAIPPLGSRSRRPELSLSPVPPLPSAAAAAVPPLSAGRRRPSPRLALLPTGALSPCRRPAGAEGRGGGGRLQATEVAGGGGSAAARGICRRPARPTGAEAVEAGLHAGADGLTRRGGRTAGGWRLRRAAVCRSSSLAPCSLSDGRHPQSPPNRPC